MVESLLLLITGVPFLIAGLYCLRLYEAQLSDDFMGTMTWDLLVEAAGAGGSWGRLAVLLLLVGVCLILFGALGTVLIMFFTVRDLVIPG